MKSDDKRLARGRRWFEYHCYEGEDSADAKLWHHTHQEVIVLSKLKNTELPMYRIRFADGLEWDVFGDELLSNQQEFERPNYTGQSLVRGSIDNDGRPS